MEKDAFYFPHFCNARHDRKIKRIRKELGLEGYGIFFMLLETLRDQLDFKYPVSDIDLLADEFGTSEQKVRCVISNYQLFEIDGDEFFFSPKLISYLEPYLNMKEQRREAGIKSGIARALISNTPFEEKNELPQTYIIECYNNDESFIKIGSTNKTISRRFSGHLPYNYKVLRQFFTDKNLDLEVELSNAFNSFKYRPRIVFAGNAECYDLKIKEDIIKYNPKTHYSHEHISNDVQTTQNEIEQRKEKKRKEKESKVNEIYSLYPATDLNNDNKSTGKSSKDRLKIGHILDTDYPLKKAIEFYLSECKRTKCYLKNFSTFLNNLPDESLLETQQVKSEPVSPVTQEQLDLLAEFYSSNGREHENDERPF